MICYHGTPITPKSAAISVLRGRHGLVSFAHQADLEVVLDACSSFVLDNGAFSAWKSGSPISDWSPYYDWVFSIWRHPGCDWAIIPDVIDGTEDDNDHLIENGWPTALRGLGVPVWHLHESLTRLLRLSRSFRVVALGSSGEYSRPGTANWWVRMGRAMDVVCDGGKPRCKLHGLRMLNPAVFTKLPLHSADSCNVARNIGIDCHWTKGSYAPATKAARAVLIADRIESNQSASSWVGYDNMESAFGICPDDSIQPELFPREETRL